MSSIPLTSATTRMFSGDAVGVLNRLLVIHYRSLPMYLKFANPWAASGDPAAKAEQALRNVIADHELFSRRFAEAIVDRDGVVELGQFPMDYAELHLLSLDFLIKEIIRFQKRDIMTIESCVAQLQHDPSAKTLAQESLGNARGHLETLEEVRQAMNAE